MVILQVSNLSICVKTALSSEHPHRIALVFWEELPRTNISVCGIGGAGGNTVNYMIQEKLEGVDFVVCNTDYRALRLFSLFFFLISVLKSLIWSM
jgi:hypothetical protein